VPLKEADEKIQFDQSLVVTPEAIHLFAFSDLKTIEKE
jgi:hypothetical protein